MCTVRRTAQWNSVVVQRCTSTLYGTSTRQETGVPRPGSRASTRSCSQPYPGSLRLRGTITASLRISESGSFLGHPTEDRVKRAG